MLLGYLAFPSQIEILWVSKIRQKGEMRQVRVLGGPVFKELGDQFQTTD